MCDLDAHADVGCSIVPFTPTYDLDAFSSTFDDPFTYHLPTFSPLLHAPMSPPTRTGTSHTTRSHPAATTNSLDNKLLGFGAPSFSHALLDERGQTWPSMSGELYGMFFLAESIAMDAERPTELTCYRRNLFQVSGSLTVSRGLAYVMTDDGRRLKITDLAVSISATESIEGKTVELIAVPWKSAPPPTLAVTTNTAGTTSPSTAAGDPPKPGTTPPTYPLDLHSNQDPSPTTLTLPLSWKRLQFKNATANNGRRKGLQQHYLIHLNLQAVLETGERVGLAEVQSGPIIVRGRSPRNFMVDANAQKDVSAPVGEMGLGNGKVSGTGTGISMTRATRRSSGGGAAVGPAAGTADLTIPSRADHLAANITSYRYYALNALQQPLDLPDWTSQTPIMQNYDTKSTYNVKAKRRGTSPSSLPPQTQTQPQKLHKDGFVVPATPLCLERPASSMRAGIKPVNLSLTDEDFGVRRSSNYSGILRSNSSSKSISNFSPTSTSHIDLSTDLTRTTTASVGVKASGHVNSPVEAADMLYEYFPLSLDDWMPPVEAIYRPHVVHHTPLVPEALKARAVRTRSKRYFSADD